MEKIISNKSEMPTVMSLQVYDVHKIQEEVAPDAYDRLCQIIMNSNVHFNKIRIDGNLKDVITILNTNNNDTAMNVFSGNYTIDEINAIMKEYSDWHYDMLGNGAHTEEVVKVARYLKNEKMLANWTLNTTIGVNKEKLELNGRLF